ncbi:hypothetical protein [Ancylobacter rudongensis]|uniref:hypothetical protein n=1 Tax=Ancylobacter rudongensis TaxID=177413 RepID=UPI00115FFA43|nr:hypothetical protein [Ancylobacter rudongensis]
MSAKRPNIMRGGFQSGAKSLSGSTLSQADKSLKDVGHTMGTTAATGVSAEMTNVDETTQRTNAALREGGIDYQVPAGGAFDAKVFTTAALKRWRKVASRLAE